MTVKELCGALSLDILAGENGLGRNVKGCYIGDLLSWVMGRANEDSAWITVMGNLNAIAVAKLKDLSCIILCERAHLDEDAKARANAHNIAVLASNEPAYELAVRISGLI